MGSCHLLRLVHLQQNLTLQVSIRRDGVDWPGIMALATNAGFMWF